MTMTLTREPPSTLRPGNPLSRVVFWAKKNLFSSWTNSLLTLLCLWLMWQLIPPLLNWAVFNANWLGTTRTDCTREGACWVFIHARFGQFMYGLYPIEQRWRINTTLIIGLVTLTPLFWRTMPGRGRYLAVWAVVYPLLVWVMLYGGFFGLNRVETRQWGLDTDLNHCRCRDCWRLATRHFTGTGASLQYAGGAHSVSGIYRVLARGAINHRAVYVLGDAAAIYDRRHQHR